MQQLEGLFISAKNYSETSVIVQLYTKQYSRQSFIFKAAKGKNKPYFFQAFHFISFSCRYNANKQLNTAYAPELVFPFYNITNDIRKTSVALFLSEVLSKTLIEGVYSDKLYDFLLSTISSFDKQDFNPNFHIYFISKLLSYLGIQPRNNYSKLYKYFNIEDACFKENMSLDINIELSYIISLFLGTNIDSYHKITANKLNRTQLINILFKYLNVHLHINTNNIKSHEILKTIFS